MGIFVIGKQIKFHISHCDLWQLKTIHFKTDLEAVFELILCKNTFILSINFMKLFKVDDSECGHPLTAFPTRVHEHIKN